MGLSHGQLRPRSPGERARLVIVDQAKSTSHRNSTSTSVPCWRTCTETSFLRVSNEAWLLRASHLIAVRLTELV